MRNIPVPDMYAAQDSGGVLDRPSVPVRIPVEIGRNEKKMCTFFSLLLHLYSRRSRIFDTGRRGGISGATHACKEGGEIRITY